MKTSLFFACTILLFACNSAQLQVDDKIAKTNTKNSLGVISLEDYYNFLGTSGTFNFSISSNKSNLPPEITDYGTYQVGGAVDQAINARNYINVGSIKIGNLSLNVNTNQRKPNTYFLMDRETCKPLFGKMLRFEIPHPNSTIKYIDSLYAPADLVMSSPVYNGNNPIQKGSDLVLKWNKDSKNQGGVIIMVDYAPLGNEPTDYSGPTPPYVFAKLVEDTGNFTLPKEILDMIPNGRGGNIQLFRGAFKLSSKQVNTRLETYRISVVSHIIITLNF